VKHTAANIRSALLASLVTAFVLAPSLLFASSGGEHVPMEMSAILWDMGIKVLNVSLLGGLAFWFLSKPLNEFVSARSRKVQQDLEDAQAGRREAEERLKVFKDKVSQLDAKIGELQKQTCGDIDREQKLLLEEAKQAAEHIRLHARDTIRQEVLKARDDLHTHAATLAVTLAEELVKKNINAEDHTRLVGEYLKEMETVK
jgi:F-type H+-transporting ATPase subunit b